MARSRAMAHGVDRIKFEKAQPHGSFEKTSEGLKVSRTCDIWIMA